MTILTLQPYWKSDLQFSKALCFVLAKNKIVSKVIILHYLFVPQAFQNNHFHDSIHIFWELPALFLWVNLYPDEPQNVLKHVKKALASSTFSRHIIIKLSAYIRWDIVRAFLWTLIWCNSPSASFFINNLDMNFELSIKRNGDNRSSCLSSGLSLIILLME